MHVNSSIENPGFSFWQTLRKLPLASSSVSLIRHPHIPVLMLFKLPFFRTSVFFMRENSKKNDITPPNACSKYPRHAGIPPLDRRNPPSTAHNPLAVLLVILEKAPYIFFSGLR
jgi:hypothetical protein